MTSAATSFEKTGCAPGTDGILGLARMMQFGDSMLPIGAFAFSSGVESAIQKGVVHNVETLRQYTLTALEQAAKGDAVAILRATRAALDSGNLDELMDIDNEVLCRKLSEEPRNMTLRMGKKLAEIGAQVTGSGFITRWLECIRQGETPGTFPVTQAILFVTMGLSRDEVPHPDALWPVSQFDDEKNSDEPTVDMRIAEVFVAHQYGVAMTILNAAMRLMRITHVDVQRIIYTLAPTFGPMCEQAMNTPLDQMSSFAPMTDILAAAHVKAHVRLFMS